MDAPENSPSLELLQHLKAWHWELGAQDSPDSAEHLGLYYSKIDSTHRAAAELPLNIFKGRRSVLLWADQQVGGFGRLGRSWHAAQGDSITMNILFSTEKIRSSGLWPLLAAWSIFRALSTWIPIAHLDIKWPNDIYIDGYKVCGLLSRQSRKAGVAWMDFGIGLNVSQQSFPEELTGIAISLQQAWSRLELTGQAPDRHEIAAVILECLLEDAEQLGDTELLRQYASVSSVIHGQEITFLEDEIQKSGITAGLDPHGALRCDIQGEGLRALNISEIQRLRPQKSPS